MIAHLTSALVNVTEELASNVGIILVLLWLLLDREDPCFGRRILALSLSITLHHIETASTRTTCMTCQQDGCSILCRRVAWLCDILPDAVQIGCEDGVCTRAVSHSEIQMPLQAKSIRSCCWTLPKSSRCVGSSRASRSHLVGTRRHNTAPARCWQARATTVTCRHSPSMDVSELAARSSLPCGRLWYVQVDVAVGSDARTCRPTCPPTLEPTRHPLVSH